jgi:hypothetical protein
MQATCKIHKQEVEIGPAPATMASSSLLWTLTSGANQFSVYRLSSSEPP